MRLQIFYTKIFLKDMEKLNIDKPEIITKATENISQMIDYVKEIIKNGYAYETSKEYTLIYQIR